MKPKIKKKENTLWTTRESLKWPIEVGARKIIGIMLLTLLSYNLLAFEYFDESIDYWSLKEPVRKPKESNKEERKNLEKAAQRVKGSAKFNWEPYLNPKTKKDLKELFREGNHTPPTPLLEVAKNPTDENIKNWFRVVKKKNQFLSRLQQRMSEYLRKSKGLDLADRGFVEMRANKIQIKSVHSDYKRFHFLMYFHSSCPHCRKMMGELKKLQRMGFYIELRQIDDNQVYAQNLPFVTLLANTKRARRSEDQLMACTSCNG